MKKLFSVFIAIILCISCFSFVGCTKREEQLKMYIPGEYIDDEIFDEFEEWYELQTGKTVEVVTPTTFDTVEQIITAVERDHADYDLVMPSDYAVEQLIKKNLLLKVERVDVEQTFMSDYVELAKISDPTLEYSVPYMYGTFGLMYDYSKTNAHIDSWSAIFTNEYNQASANKDSLREAMTSAAIWANREELSSLSNGFTDYNDAYKAKLQSIYGDVSDNAIERAKSALNAARGFNKIWGGEDLKFEMAAGSSSIKVALMWSCDAGYVMNSYEDADGNEKAGNRNLWYVVPKEGGNVYLDSFVISKYAKNVEAAQYFLEFICQKEIAMTNSAYAGAISPVAEAYRQLESDYSAELSNEVDIDEAWKDMYLDMLFPSAETLARCGTMRAYGDNDAKVTLAWSDVRHSS
ncbi:MAG: extracellular solute-binding protein [Clostridia bacterium]|nr:extracellular solute-binding protein [Clostridia bacterium]